MRLGVPDKVECFVGVDSGRSYGAADTASHLDVENCVSSYRQTRRAHNSTGWQCGVGARRIHIAVIRDQAGAT